MTPIASAPAPRIDLSRSTSQLTVDVRMRTPGLLPERWHSSGAKLRIALSAVIEDEDGSVSCWALKHAPGKPDFHHPAGFLLEV